MTLKTKIVVVEDVGEIEVRELAYSEAEALFELDSSKLGKELIKRCLYLNGERIFDTGIGISVANKLFLLSADVLEVNGMGKPKSR